MTEFDQWYYGVDDDDPGYIRKEARGDARKAFPAARKIATLEELIEGRKAYAREKEGTDKKYIQLPASWLRAEGWANEYTEDNPINHMSYDERREYSRQLMAGLRVIK